MKINDSPLTSALEAIHKSQRTIADQIAQSFSGVNGWIESIKVPIAAINSHVAKLAENIKPLWTKLDESFAKALEGAHETPEKAKLIAELGWVIPNHASLPEYAELIAPINDIQSADEAFMNYYLKDNAIELKALKEDLLNSIDIKTWRPALEEAFLDLDDGRHMSCIALLLPLIDGLTSTKFSVPKFYKSKYRKAFFKEKLRVAKTGYLNKYFWQSYEAFANNFFRSCQSSPSFLNRNWLFHGRDIPSSNLSDCLRLLQALETITNLH